MRHVAFMKPVLHRALILSLFFLSLPVFLAAAETIYLVRPHAGITAFDSEASPYTKRAPDKVLFTKDVTWNITYADPQGVGFNDPSEGAERRARLEDTLEYISSVINEDGTIDIEVEPSFFDTSTGLLASAGTFYTSTPGFQRGFTLQRLITGQKPFEGVPEISMQVNFGWDWNATTGPPAANEIDLMTVLLHEITHGLGFAGLGGPDGQSELFDNVFTTFDRFVIRGSREEALWAGNPPDFQGTPADLTSNDLFFNGPNAFDGYDEGVSPGIYAPNPYEQGSSISHWDTGNIVGGAVMEHAVASGVMMREFPPLEIGALVDIGYANAALPGETFTLTVDISGQGSVTRTPNETSYTEGEQVSLTAVPASGWEFVEWIGNVDNPNSPTTTITMNQDETVTVVFQDEATAGFRLIVNITGEGSVTRDPDKQRYEDGEVVTLTAEPAGTHRFVEWMGDVADADAPTTTITMNSDETVTAVFEEVPPSEALIIQVEGSGTVERVPDKPLYVAGEVVQLTAQALPGWEFDRWIGPVQNPNSAITTVVVSQTLTLTAIFVPREDLQLQINISGQGQVRRDPELPSYMAGQRVNLTAIASPGWRFVEWQGGTNSRLLPSTFVVISADTTIRAIFEQAPTDLRLTVSQRGQGQVTRLPDAEFYTPDTRVELTAIPEAGWRFDRWEGAVEDPLAPTTEIVMRDDEEVIANFVVAFARLEIEPAVQQVVFPPTQVSATSEVVFTVRNAGGGEINGQARIDGGPFEFGGERNYQLAPGESQQIVVRFIPTQPGTYEGVLTFSGGEAGPVSVVLLGSVAKVANAGCSATAPPGGGLTGDALVVLAALVLLALAHRQVRSQS